MWPSPSVSILSNNSLIFCLQSRDRPLRLISGRQPLASRMWLGPSPSRGAASGTDVREVEDSSFRTPFSSLWNSTALIGSVSPRIREGTESSRSSVINGSCSRIRDGTASSRTSGSFAHEGGVRTSGLAPGSSIHRGRASSLSPATSLSEGRSSSRSHVSPVPAAAPHAAAQARPVSSSSFSSTTIGCGGGGVADACEHLLRALLWSSGLSRAGLGVARGVALASATSGTRSSLAP
mmetsp:Transcript_44634/g.127343  ORF Transcript_44634/g.127343 Transcript_44634/m.127343 type:complete len:236 (+) Transcript_44634:330-1037(+)